MIQVMFVKSRQWNIYLQTGNTIFRCASISCTDDCHRLTDSSKLEIGNFSCLIVLPPTLSYSIQWEWFVSSVWSRHILHTFQFAQFSAFSSASLDGFSVLFFRWTLHLEPRVPWTNHIWKYFRSILTSGIDSPYQN